MVSVVPTRSATAVRRPVRLSCSKRAADHGGGAVRESAPECGEAGRGGLPRSKATVVELAAAAARNGAIAAALSASSCRLPVSRDTEFPCRPGSPARA